jgi:asparagine synthase (glutamine-hydrolysing)
MTALAGEWLAELVWEDDGPAFELVCEPGRHRPQVARSEPLTVVLDGALYNRPELERSLDRTHHGSDGELVLEGYRSLRGALIGRLRGRFSLVIWDSSAGELVAARDPLGVRPLFYAVLPRGLVVSPYLDAVLRHEAVDRTIDRMVAGAQMILGLPAGPEETVFRSLRRIPAGHHLRARRGSWELRRHWEPATRAETGGDSSETFRVLFDQAVRRCHGGGRIAVFLSGGIDSATVAAAAGQLSHERGLRAPCAISLFNPTTGANEASTQRRIAAALDLSLIGAAPDELVPAGTALTAAFQLAPLSSWPPGLLAPSFEALARQAIDEGCTTLLTGDGGDEWLLPLSSWAADRILHLDLHALRLMWGAWPYTYPGFRRRGLARALLWTWGARPVLRGLAARPLGRWSPGRLRGLRARTLLSGLPDWFLPAAVGRAELADWWIERSPEVPVTRLHQQERLYLLTASFSSGLMEEAFANGRRLGAEVLTPFWDVDLIEFLLGLPGRVLLRGGRAKALARDYLARHVPFAETWPPKTVADSVAVALLEREGGTAWRELGGAPLLGDLGIVDVGQLEARLGAHRPGSPLPDAPLLWDAMVLESWLGSRILAT